MTPPRHGRVAGRMAGAIAMTRRALCLLSILIAAGCTIRGVEVLQVGKSDPIRFHCAALAAVHHESMHDTELALAVRDARPRRYAGLFTAGGRFEVLEFDSWTHPHIVLIQDVTHLLAQFGFRVLPDVPGSTPLRALEIELRSATGALHAQCGRGRNYVEGEIELAARVVATDSSRFWSTEIAVSDSVSLGRRDGVAFELALNGAYCRVLAVLADSLGGAAFQASLRAGATPR